MTEKCTICMEEFTKSDKVSELKCDNRHIFHSYCLEKWFEANKDDLLRCPLCKETVIRSQLENAI